jgi:hypothetical protein
MDSDERQARNVFALLIEETRRLASSAEEQTAYLDQIKTGADELRMEFLDVGSVLFPLYREYDLVDYLDEESVLAVERHLSSGAEDDERHRENFYYWSRSKNLSFWIETRRLAKVALDFLTRPQSEKQIP